MDVWYSKIQVHGKVIFLGNYNTAEKAHEAFEAAHAKHHGEFSTPVNC
jgi:ribosomal protein L16/L10AE